MIVAVTPNPALDLTYAVPSLAPGTSHAVTEVQARAGGKGINVASVAHLMGEPVVAIVPLGGPTGDVVAADLAARGIPAVIVPVAGETRRCVAVVPADGAEATVLNEPGPVLSPAEWDAVLAAVRTAVGQARSEYAGHVAVVCSGSFPPGLPADAPAQLVRLAHELGVPAILDTSGAALAAGLAAGPDLIKPNLAEAAALVDSVGAQLDARTAAHALLARGAHAAAVSDGPRGVVLATHAGVLHARLAEPVAGNPTGAGDALVAGLATGLAHASHSAHADHSGRAAGPGHAADAADAGRSPWTCAILGEACAWAAAAVLSPVAGDLDPATVASLRGSVRHGDLTSADPTTADPTTADLTTADPTTADPTTDPDPRGGTNTPTEGQP